MAWEKSFDELEAVRAARTVFWERGYTATSLAQLLAATGLSKSSLYEAFGSKRGLFDRAIDSYLDEVMEPLLEGLEKMGAGRPQLLAWFGSFATAFRSDTRLEATRGCFMLNTAMELNELDEVAAKKVNQFRLRVREAMFHAVQSIDGDPAVAALRADVLAAAQIGMMITSRMDPLGAAAFADTLAADIAAW